MPGCLSAIVEATPELIASATLRTDTRGNGFIDITADVAGFIDSIGASEGVLLIFLRHTSASLTIQENADACARKRELDPRRGRSGRHAGARKGNAERRVTTGTSNPQKTCARDLAGHLPR